ncbi:MAG: hypothetical protein RBS37_00240 [Bacteroidales bacterium]|jgi:hypothetical protein|nr:hypothetical protein [Bacteroidales bacterium]
MNRKHLNKALIAGVIILWVFIGYGIINIVQRPPGVSGQVRTSAPSHVIVEDDTISLLLNYRDPFMTFRLSTHEGVKKSNNSSSGVPVTVVQNVQQIIWPKVTLKGTVISTDGTSKLALISIENRLHLMHQGDIAEEVSLIKLETDSVTIAFKNQTRTIK